MKKSAIRIACLSLSMLTAFSLVACGEETPSNGEKNYTYDPESRPVVFATEALDGNFNPFFATSGTDTEMASMTQIGMLSTDEKGNTVCGEDEPTVALAYNVKDVENGKYTDYEFIIKNGIKFSDGKDLTIKDVLFNIYVYLDPSYMGSATMYSTDIVGLKKYRAQDPTLIEEGFDESSLNKKFNGEAIQRRQNILDYLDDEIEATQQILDDIQYIKTEFKDEVTSDWTMSQGAQESYKDEYTFTEDWQIYYFNEGIVRIVNDAQGKPLKDENDKYITNITPAGVTLKNGTVYDENYLQFGYAADLVDDITAEINNQAKLKEYADKGVSEEDAKTLLAKEFAVKTVYEAYTDTDLYVDDILLYWATGSNVFEDFVAEARTAHYDDLIKNNQGKLLVETISGITTDKTDVDFNGNALSEEHDVLKIRINGVDPKAIYNFAFAVAPMHYYSGTFDGVDYVAKADGISNFGVAFNNNKFFEDVLQADAKNAKPVGAGAYQVSNEKGETGSSVDGTEFYSNNWVYFARNDYFETVGEGMNNAKIKYLHYRVVNSDKLIQALQAKNIDVGEPNATAANITEIGNIAHLNQKTVPTNGYGYVGVNPKYVPDIEVRKAIMKAMDPINCLNYYTKANASIIYRPMSNESWIWDYVKQPTSAYHSIATSNKEITDLVESAGWKKNAAGIYEKDGKTLKLTFTIAGATTDHPAYEMFRQAEATLDACGFDITVTTDISALKKLATGQLEVWAAAWSSTVDPDMYQVYHKDSKATSVNNWGYPTILNDSTGDFAQEQNIINQLSVLIEQGRETNDKKKRSEIYEDALTLVMDLAVELPTYQRNDCVAYNKEVIDPASLNQNPTAFAGVIDRVWELDYN